MVDFIRKNILCEMLLSILIFLSIASLITLIILIRINRPKKYRELSVSDILITGLQSFDFYYKYSTPEYPHENLGTTGKVTVNCATGICTREDYHRHFVEVCEENGNCVMENRSWTEIRKIIDHDCSEQCFNNSTINECVCDKPYLSKGICDRKNDSTYLEGKVCYTDNVIYLWKKRTINNIKMDNYSYLEDVKLKDEECPSGTKFCGILDNDEKKLCLKKNRTCPINYLSENKINNDYYSSVNIGDKIFYYGNDNTTNRKIIYGIVADTDIYPYNNEEHEKDVIDNYTLKEFLEENKNLYKDINLGYDPYNINDIDSKGKSYLNILYSNKNVDLVNLRKKKEQQIFNHKMNYKYLDSIHYNTKIILIIGLIALGLFLIVFIIAIYNQFTFYLKDWYDHDCIKCDYITPIVLYLILIISPLIFGCLNIRKVCNAEKIDSITNYSLFKKLNIAFITIGFSLFPALIVFLVFVPIKCFKENIPKEINNEVNDINATMTNLKTIIKDKNKDEDKDKNKEKNFIQK